MKRSSYGAHHREPKVGKVQSVIRSILWQVVVGHIHALIDVIVNNNTRRELSCHSLNSLAVVMTTTANILP